MIVIIYNAEVIRLQIFRVLMTIVDKITLLSYKIIITYWSRLLGPVRENIKPRS